MATTGVGAAAPSKAGRWCAAHGKTHPLSWFDADKASCHRAEKAVQRMAEEARAAGSSAFAEPCVSKPKEMPGAPPWAGEDGAFLMMRLSRETRGQWFALFDRDPEWCRKAFAEFAAAALAADG
jgi:hypothetical protein